MSGEMTEMVERVARALCAFEGDPEGIGVASFYNMARTAIQAMEEPTQQQMNAGYQFLLADSSKNGYADRTDAEKMERMRGFYKAMINVAVGDEW